MISDRAAIELLWSETGRDGSPLDDYGDPVLTRAFADMMSYCPRAAAVFLYEPSSGLDNYVRAWYAAQDDMPVRWALAVALRFGIVTGTQEPWSECGRRMGLDYSTAREHAAKGLTWLWMSFNGRGGENLHQLRAAAAEALQEPGTPGGQPGPAAPLEDEGLWQPTHARRCRKWYTGAEIRARFGSSVFVRP